MQVERVKRVPVSVPVASPLRTGGGASDTYDRVLVRVELDDGTVGFGEVAPHPDWPRSGTRADCLATLDELAPRVEGTDPYRRVRTADRLADAAAPFSRCGLDVALHDALARRLGVPLYELLGGRARDELALHATLGQEPPDVVADRAAEAADAGFSAFKLKVGDADDAARVRAVREAVPDARVRVDANGAWTAGEAVRRVRELDEAAGGLVFVEQPVDGTEPLRRVRRAVETPVLADESCSDADDVAALAAADACDGVNLKLANAGGFVGAGRAAVVASTHGLSILVGGMLELGVGAAASAHFAVSTAGVAHPTGVLNRFAADLLIEEEDRWTPGGPRFVVPDAPGLGVTVDEEAVERYRTD